jgi:serine/threonine-protein kinase
MTGGEGQGNGQLERMQAALADHYEVQRKLGEGGMALVYLARDLKHDRLVAIKVLKPDLAASIGAERFLKEIRHTAKLTHPHILPLYDSGDADGILYYVMPFVEGESLSDFMKREKQLAIQEAVQITREVAEALAYAHSYGLIHRDIKPDNILMSGGHAIVADFGISKALSEAGTEQLTQTGTSVGTPAYMSPEQAMGSPDVDGRSDIYSLGCVFYQMLVGDIPFTGPTPQSIMARHAMDHITPPHIMRDTIPDDLEGVIYAAMAKTPADRFRTAHEMAEALRTYEAGLGVGQRASIAAQRVSIATQRASLAQGMPGVFTPQTPVPQLSPARPAWRRAAVPVGVAMALAIAGLIGWKFLNDGRGAAVDGLDARRVAVLYFEDLSPDGSLAHVADGLTEGLIQELSSVQGLDVLSRNGVAPYRGTNIRLDSVARALEAGSLIQGSIEPVGDRVRVSTRLVDGVSGADVGRAPSFELPQRQLLAVRDSVVREVGRLLRTRLGDEVRVKERRAATESLDAWLLVQRAERVRKEAQARRGTPAAADSSYARADSLLQLSSAADARWPEPVTLQAQVAYERAFLQRDRSRQTTWLRSAAQYATQALGLRPGYPSALTARGRARRVLYRTDASLSPGARDRLLDSAEADLKAATEADGSQAAAYRELSQLYYDKKDNVSAALAARRAYEADAFLGSQSANLNQLFWAYYDLEVFPDAQRWCEEGVRLFPGHYNFAKCRLWLMITEQAQPDISRAWALADSVAQRAPDARRAYEAHLATLIVGGALARAGLKDSARHVLDAARAGRDVDPTQELPGYEAIMRILVGDYPEAITLLKTYVLAHPTEEFTSGRDLHWWWRPLRDFPEFQAVVARRQ